MPLASTLGRRHVFRIPRCTVIGPGPAAGVPAPPEYRRPGERLPYSKSPVSDLCIAGRGVSATPLLGGGHMRSFIRAVSAHFPPPSPTRPETGPRWPREYPRPFKCGPVFSPLEAARKYATYCRSRPAPQSPRPGGGCGCRRDPSAAACASTHKVAAEAAGAGPLRSPAL